MGTVPAILSSRWRSRQLTGDAKHQQIVRIRKGRMHRGYRSFTLLGTSDEPPAGLPTIWLGNNVNPWNAWWNPEPTTTWTTLPNIQSVQGTKTKANDNGTETRTVTMDNIAFPDTEGVGGMFHEIVRGYYSPQRGVKVSTRPNMWTAAGWGTQDTFKDSLNGGYQLEVWEGYGPDNDPTTTPFPNAHDTFVWQDGSDGENGSWVVSSADDAVGGGGETCVPPNAAITRTFTGLIDSCDIGSHPDTITLTVRDFGMLITDQNMIYHNKAPECPSPVIFADKGRVLGETSVGYAYAASGHYQSYLPSDAAPEGTGWVSDSQGSTDDYVWIEFKLTAGYYSQFLLATEAPGQQVYVCFQGAGGGTTEWNGTPVSDGDWAGEDSVPSDASVNYITHIKTVPVGATRFNLNGQLKAGEGTIMRVYVTKLNTNLYDDNGNAITVPGFVGNIKTVFGLRYGTSAANSPVPALKGVGSQFKAQGWVLIDDVATIARTIFMWAGFHEWDVDNFEWSLAMPFTFGQDQAFIDVLTSVENQAAYMFYMKAPTDYDLSIGVPCFKRIRIGHAGVGGSFAPVPSVALTTRDVDTLEAHDATFDLSNLPFSIRVRGAINSNGVTFGQDLSKRYAAVYYPPWSGDDYVKRSPTVRGRTTDRSERLAGLRRLYVQTQGQVISLSMNTDADCMFAAIMTAVQYAIGETTGNFQISGHPGVELNQAVVVMDEATGTNSRIWVTSIQSQHNMGEQGSWHMTFQGVLLDTEDMNLISEDWAYALFKYAMAHR